MNPLYGNFINQLLNHPKIRNNASAKGMLSAIVNGDQAKGEEIAMNLCNEHHCDKDQALKMAKQFFNLR